MSFLYTKEEEQRSGANTVAGTVVSKGEASFMENLKASYKFSEYNNTSVSESIVMQEQWQPYVDIIEENRDRLGIKDNVVNPGFYLQMGIFNDSR